MGCSSETQSNNASATPANFDTTSAAGLSRAQRRLYSKDHLEAYDLLDSPIWVFDIENKAMWWANEAACYLWSAATSESLTQRDFASDMSKENDNWLEKFALGEDNRATRTFHPNGGKDGPKTCDLLMSGIWVSKSGLEEDRRFCSLVVVEKVTDGKSQDKEDVESIRRADITKVMLEAAKEEAEKQNMKRNEFFAVMAHDIRTPLHQVVGSIKLLAASGMNAEQTESVDMLQTSAHGLLAIINDLLDFTNLEAGKMKIETIPFDVRGVLEGSVASLRSQVHDKGLDVSCQIDQGVPIRLMGDPNRLRQVVLNMLSNAVKFTSHGRVNIESKTMPQEDGSIRIRFTVADTGIGIAKDEYERIFNPYEQAEVSVSRIYGGTGLGLAICKSLVENMGGEIGVTSVVGEGTTFWFEMPFGLYATPHVPEEKKVDSDSDPSDEIAGLEVLVAEDNKMNQKVVVRMLQRLGHHATVVENGQECVAEISNSPKKYNIILMDWQMPVMDGIDATKELRSKGYNMSDLPIVGLTASVDYLDFFELGMNDCLKKPVRILDLKAALIKNVS